MPFFFTYLILSIIASSILRRKYLFCETTQLSSNPHRFSYLTRAISWLSRSKTSKAFPPVITTPWDILELCSISRKRIWLTQSGVNPQSNQRGETRPSGLYLATRPPLQPQVKDICKEQAQAVMSHKLPFSNLSASRQHLLVGTVL